MTQSREERWLNDPTYHARVSVVRAWMERAWMERSGVASDELLISYAMNAIEDLDRLLSEPS